MEIMVTHQLQGSHVAIALRPSSGNGKVKLKHHRTRFNAVGITDWRPLLKRNICFSVGPPCICGAKLKTLRISAFKGGAQNQDFTAKANGSKFSQHSVRLIENEESTAESPVPLSYDSEVNQSDAKSSSIHKLFSKWLTILRSPPPNQVVNGILEEDSSVEASESSQETQNREGGHILKVAWSWFRDLNMTIKVPLLIFIPFYLATNIAYGTEVSKELIPLWVFGPIIVALYVKMMQKLIALYVFCFTQSVKVIKNAPTYNSIARSYIRNGKLKEDIQGHVVQRVVRIKNLNYKELSRKKWKQFEEWSIEKYLDFVESIWPYYCRTLRFLKRANLI